MLILHDISYKHPNRDLLFEKINITINDFDKVALIGNNGVGKSSLLKIISGELKPSGGQLETKVLPYYVPQVYGQFNHLSIAQALGVDRKLAALREIIGGNAAEENFTTLNEDWAIEERCREALMYWQLENMDMNQQLDSLSGGQKTKVFLAGIQLHQPDFILLDEPGNHLDFEGRQLLNDFIQTTQSTLMVVSHDRKLLNLLNTVFELSRKGVAVYGGNYDFYALQKQVETGALLSDLQSQEKELRKAKEKERETLERQQKLDSRGKKQQEKAGVAKIMMNTLRNNAEKSTAKLKYVHAEKIEGLSGELKNLRALIPAIDQMKLSINDSFLHKGKILITGQGINYSYGSKPLWTSNQDIQVTSGERIAIKGINGSGKSTLLGLIMGKMEPSSGKMVRAVFNVVNIDQEYSLISKDKTVYDQALLFNNGGLQEHEVKIRLHRFLFGKEDWDKTCRVLSGGERLRLVLCCLTILAQSPDMIVLDEPTNNLDIQNMDILINVIRDYKGTLLVVSHDEYFLQQVNIDRCIHLQSGFPT